MSSRRKSIVLVAVAAFCVSMAAKHLLTSDRETAQDWNAVQLNPQADHPSASDSSFQAPEAMIAASAFQFPNSEPLIETAGETTHQTGSENRITSLPDFDDQPGSQVRAENTPYKAVLSGSSVNPFYKAPTARRDYPATDKPAFAAADPQAPGESNEVAASDDRSTEIADRTNTVSDPDQTDWVASTSASAPGQGPLTATSSAAPDLTSEFRPAGEAVSISSVAGDQTNSRIGEQATFANSSSQTSSFVSEEPAALPSENLATAGNESPASPSTRPSPVVEQRAREHTIYGNSLARRGSTYAARQEYLHALRLIAESYDMQHGGRAFTGSLAAALKALNESNDFLARESERQLTLDLRPIVAGHSSRVIDSQQIAEMTPIHAMQAYHEYALQALTEAVGKSAVASEALYALGKIFNGGATFDPSARQVDQAKAIVMFQASLAADQANYRSANELGVLMAQNGQWDQAKHLFQESLRSHQTLAGWQNLMKVHQTLGEDSFARLAQKEYDRMLARANTNTDSIREVSVAELNQQAAGSDFSDAATTRVAQANDKTLGAKASRIFKPLKDLF